MEYRHVTRNRRLTPEEAAKYRKIREEVEKEFPPLQKQAETAPTDVAALLAKLKARREAAGLSLADLAERTGMDKAVLSRLENGHVPNPTVQTLYRYAGAVGTRIILDLADPSKPGS